MAFTNVYDDTFPADTELANLIGSNLRQVRLDVQQRMAAITGVSTSLPPFASDAQPSNWNGILCFATDNGHLYQFNGATWTDVTSTFLTSTFGGLIFGSASPLSISGGVTQYYTLFQATGGSEAQVKAPIPVSGAFTALYVQTATAQPSTGSLQISVRVNGGSVLTVTVAASSAAGVYSTTGTGTFSAGNFVNWQITNNASSISAGIQSMLFAY